MRRRGMLEREVGEGFGKGRVGEWLAFYTSRAPFENPIHVP